MASLFCLLSPLVRRAPPLVCVWISLSAWSQTPVAIGAEDDAAPWSYADGTGYVNDVVRLAFARVGWQTDLKVMPYARCKYLAIKGELAACFSASKQAELQDKLTYSQRPVFAAQNWLIAREDSNWQGCDPKTWPRAPQIGTVREYEYRPALVQLFAARQALKAETDSEVSNLRKLQAGRIDMAVVTVDPIKRLETLSIQAQTNTPLKTVCDLGSEPAFVAFSKTHAQGLAAQAAFDKGYAQLQSSGTVSSLQETWRARLLETSRVKPH